jgi:cupin 2 domain-containing protein
MVDVTGNIFEHILSETVDEEFTELLAAEGLRIERIVSAGQASPPGFWYEQAWSEWVLVLSGSAGLLFDNEPPLRELKKGDYLLIPAGRPHLAEWTGATEPTIWLAVHFRSLSSSGAAEADDTSYGLDLKSGSSLVKSEG